MTDVQPGTPATSDEQPILDLIAALAADAFQAHDHDQTPLIEGDWHCVPCWLTARSVAAAVLRSVRPLIEAEAAAKVAAIAKQEMQALSEDLIALGARSMENACAETAEAVRLASDAKWRENLAAQRKAIAANIRGTYWPDLAQKIAGQIERGEL